MGARVPEGIERAEEGLTFPSAGTLAGVSPHVRLMAASDVPEVARIEASAFATPWKEETFHNLLPRPGAELWVVQSTAGEILAYAVLWLILDQGELANIAVREDQRGQGLGSLLLDHLLAVAREREVVSIYLEVRVSNEVAYQMYLTRGFEQVSVRPGYYQDPPEDARLMVLHI